jgi:hypothetical protein
MKKLILLIGCLWSTTSLLAQITELPVAEVKAPRFQPNENMVLFAKNSPKATIYNYLESYLVYPADATKYNEQGMVIVTFMVDVDGTLKEFVVLNQVSNSLDECVINCLSQTSGNWMPAQVNGIVTPMASKVYVKFFLSDENSYTRIATNFYMSALKHMDKGAVLQQAGVVTLPKAQKQYYRCIYNLEEATKMYPDCAALAYQQMRAYGKLGDEIHQKQMTEKYFDLINKIPITEKENEYAEITKK